MIILKGDGECRCRFGVSCGLRDDEEENPSLVTWCRLSRRPRGAICCRILSSNRRISLRLSLLMRLVMRQEMSPCIRELSLGLPRRLGRLRGGLSLRLRLPGVVLGLRLLHLHRSALNHHLLLGVFRPRRNRPIPLGNVGVFGSRSLSPRPA